MTTKQFRYLWREHISGDSSLTSTQKWVAHALFFYMDAEGGSCYPSIVRIAFETGFADSTVREALSALDSKGYLRREPGRGRSHTTRYQATLPPDGNRRQPATLEEGNRRLTEGKPPTEAANTAGRQRQVLKRNTRETEARRGRPADAAAPAPRWRMLDDCTLCGERLPLDEYPIDDEYGRRHLSLCDDCALNGEFAT